MDEIRGEFPSTVLSPRFTPENEKISSTSSLWEMKNFLLFLSFVLESEDSRLF
jgi:hypothetical protein